MMNEKCAACIHCEVCGFIESEVAKDGACDFYEDGKRWRPIKTGHWIDIMNKNGTVIAIRCDCCGNSPKHAVKSDFCPNCGAKMFEPQESEG